MKMNSVARSLAIAAQFMILMAAPALSHTQSAAPVVQPSGLSGTQGDPYADDFAGLIYTDAQKVAINKIRQDVASRRAAVLADGKLTNDQKNAMLTGYMRIEYGLIYKELTNEQKKLVSTRMRARRASDQAAEKAQAPAR